MKANKDNDLLIRNGVIPNHKLKMSSMYGKMDSEIDQSGNPVPADQQPLGESKEEEKLEYFTD